MGRQSGKVSTDRELDETAFQGYNTEIDDNAAAQAYAIGKAATMSPTWRTLGMYFFYELHMILFVFYDSVMN